MIGTWALTPARRVGETPGNQTDRAQCALVDCAVAYTGPYAAFWFWLKVALQRNFFVSQMFSALLVLKCFIGLMEPEAPSVSPYHSGIP